GALPQGRGDAPRRRRVARTAGRLAGGLWHGCRCRGGRLRWAGQGADLVPVVPAGTGAVRGRRRGRGRLRRRRTRASPPRRRLAAGLRAPGQRRRHRARARLTRSAPVSRVGHADPGCPLCHGDGGRLLVRHDDWRVVLADDPDYPAFTRVIWNAHVAEMSDLRPAERDELMRVVLAVERVQRESLSPDKVNLASFG